MGYGVVIPPEAFIECVDIENSESIDLFSLTVGIAFPPRNLRYRLNYFNRLQ